jgi:SAM-dependent methyltransferase
VNALRVFDAALHRAAAERPARLDLVSAGGRTVDRVDAAQWSAVLRPGDRSLLSRCQGSTLDVGCGPGRLAAALTREGRSALGVDISREAVRLARQRGARAWHGSVFANLPMEGRWSCVLLADGNIGIGGDPHRLLRRCARLLRPGGSVLAELAPPGSPTWAGPVRLRLDGQLSHPFPWAAVAAPDVAGVADRAGLGVRTLWTEAGRWFAHLRG